MARHATANAAFAHRSDEEVRARERAESERLMREARQTAAEMRAVAARVRRMSALYRERLEGNRSQREQP